MALEEATWSKVGNMFRTGILNDVTGPCVERAQREAAEAKDHLHEVVSSEVFGASARAAILEAANAYALSRQRIMEAKVGQEAHDFVQADLRAFSQTMAAVGLRSD